MAGKIRNRVLVMLAATALFALSCDSPDAPVPQGSVTFRFERAPQQALVAHGGLPALLDSVAVVVFRGGAGLTEETRVGASVTVDPVEVTIPCIAEPNKRVSVELFGSGAMYYHGANEDVDVVANKRSDVLVDAYQFYVPSLAVTPGTVAEGGSFDLAWLSTAGARTYRVQASTSSDFASIEWEQSLTDTLATATLPPGAHHFRVAPQTPFATGSFAGPEETYVLGGSGSLLVTGFGAPGVIPGEIVSVLGENLDYPGTQMEIGGLPMQVVSAAWGELVVRMPRGGTTNVVDVRSGLGSATSAKELIALRVAYVTDGGTHAAEYASVLAAYSGDFGKSGVVTVPVEELDWRDMNVFDIVMVAHDSGVTEPSWGGGVPARAARIAESRSNVVAIGLGGAIFLRLAGATTAVHQTTIDGDGAYYVPNNGGVFGSPHPVGSGLVDFSAIRPVTVDFAIAGAPAGTNLHASTDQSCFLLICNPNDRWVLADFSLVNPGGTTVTYFFWGYADDPAALTTEGTDCLGNVMYLLFNTVSPAP